MNRWKPNITVAAVIERDGEFLFVEEKTPHGPRFNQPAGHLEFAETLVQACQRETLEETAWEFEPQALVGIYQWTQLQQKNNSEPCTFLRFAFSGALGVQHADQPLAEGIIRTVWLSLMEIEELQHIHRSPMVGQCVRDWISGKYMPLTFLQNFL